jgi:hypothetical protein
LIVKVDQPKAVFTQILFEPTNKMTDSLSYDITAWNLPLAYGVQGYAVKNALNLKTKNVAETASKSIQKLFMHFMFLGIIELQQKFWHNFNRKILK